MTKAHGDVLRLRIELRDTDIWRDILVPGGFKLSQLHRVIQVSMGWGDAHPHEFLRNGAKLGEQKLVAEELGRRGARITYVYDDSESWEHVVVLSDKLADDGRALPTCVGGDMASPPEGCGGVAGYHHLVHVLQKKRRTAEDKELVSWAEEWTPAAFSVDSVNARLVKAFRKGRSKDDEAASVAAAAASSFTAKQGQYLSFIFWYTRMHRQPPAASDVAKFFGVSSPAVTQMVDTLHRNGLLGREAHTPRSLKVLIPEGTLPRLEEPPTPMLPPRKGWTSKPPG